MRHGHRILSSWFLILWVSEAAVAAKPLARVSVACERAFIRAGLKSELNPPRFLTEQRAQTLAYSARLPRDSSAHRFEEYWLAWQAARVSHMSDEDASLVRLAAHHLRHESLAGQRENGLLAQAVRQPGLEHSLLAVVDYIEQLEAEIVYLEYAGWIKPRARLGRTTPPTEAEQKRVYFKDVIRGGHEFVSALPPEVIQAEMERISRLTSLPWRVKRFALRMLATAGKSRRAYGRLVGRTYLLGEGYYPRWRVVDAPANYPDDKHRAAFRRMIERWVEVDRRVQDTLGSPDSNSFVAILLGQDAPLGAVSPVDAEIAIRRLAILDDWRVMRTWDANRRRLVLKMIELSPFGKTYARRLTDAVALSTLGDVEYLARKSNQERLTGPWTE